MKKRKMLGTFMFMVPFMIVGCGKDVTLEQGKAQVETAEEDKKSEVNLFSSISGKEKFKGIKIKAPNNLKKIETSEDMLLYAIEDSKRSISIGSDYIEGSLDDYMKKVKDVLGEVIDLSGAVQENITVDNIDAETLEYKYKLDEIDSCIYQVCFEHEKIAYILTLWSNDENIEADKKIVEKILQSVDK